MIQVLDVGGGYNNNDGIFDVPVTGIYVFTYTIYSNLHQFIKAELVINGQVKTSLYADADNVEAYHTGTATIVIHANAGDHVFVRLSNNWTECGVLSSFQQALSTFSGWLLY